MSVDFKFNKIQLQRTRPEGFKFPIGLSFGALGPTGNSAADTEGGLQRCLAGPSGPVAGGNTFHIFANPSGSGTFTPSFTGEIDLLVVAGGGGGGSFLGGGGGGGGIVFASNFPVVDNRDYTITVGSGGSLAPDRSAGGGPYGGTQGGGGAGSNSSFTDTSTSVAVTSMFGGGGAGWATSFGGGDGGFGKGMDGGSGGGATMNSGPGRHGSAVGFGFQPVTNPGISGVENNGNPGGLGGQTHDNPLNPYGWNSSTQQPGVAGGGGGAGQAGGGRVPGTAGSVPGQPSTAVSNEIGGKAPVATTSQGHSGGTGLNFSGFAEAGVGTPGGFGIGIATQTNGFFGGGGGAGGYGPSELVGKGGAGGGGGEPFAVPSANSTFTSEPGSTSLTGLGLANTGGGGRGGTGTVGGTGAGNPSPVGPKAGGSGIVVIKYKTDAGLAEGFFIS